MIIYSMKGRKGLKGTDKTYRFTFVDGGELASYCDVDKHLNFLGGTFIEGSEPQKSK